MEEQELKSILGKNIKFLRFRRQFSQADLAEKAGISITFLSNIERGNNFPLAGTLCNLAKALEVDVFELFKGTIVPEDHREVICSLSEDIKGTILSALDNVFKQYMG
ncbi:MAG: helix-turn-helix domain-containing protein [Spirochaetaceae bacterium]|jgi:transcriptional regulator with XRE-family HTH domain|nr:helix-turn-helix domain-containing protein [Spirochaetaceae bacterium]